MRKNLKLHKGKINLLDLLIVIFIILVLIVGIKFFFFQKEKWVNVNVQVCDINRFGDLINCGNTPKYLYDEIVKINEIKDNDKIIGKIEKINLPTGIKTNILLKMQLLVDVNRKGQFKFEGKSLKVNSQIRFITDKINIDGKVAYVETTEISKQLRTIEVKMENIEPEI